MGLLLLRNLVKTATTTKINCKNSFTFVVSSQRSLNCNTYAEDGPLYRTAIGESNVSLDSTLRSGKSRSSSYLAYALRYTATDCMAAFTRVLHEHCWVFLVSIPVFDKAFNVSYLLTHTSQYPRYAGSLSFIHDYLLFPYLYLVPLSLLLKVSLFFSCFSHMYDVL